MCQIWHVNRDYVPKSILTCPEGCTVTLQVSFLILESSSKHLQVRVGNQQSYYVFQLRNLLLKGSIQADYLAFKIFFIYILQNSCCIYCNNFLKLILVATVKEVFSFIILWLGFAYVYVGYWCWHVSFCAKPPCWILLIYKSFFIDSLDFSSPLTFLWNFTKLFNSERYYFLSWLDLLSFA